MVKSKKVEAWAFKEIGFTKTENNVTSIHCKICNEYYCDDEVGKIELEKLTGPIKVAVLNWVGGSKVVKKTNINDHLKAKYHLTALRVLKERANNKVETTQITETNL